MDLPDMSDHNRAVRLYWIALVATMLVVGVWIAYASPTFTAVQWAQYLLPSILIMASLYGVRKVLLERLSAKAREAEAMSRLHLATAEALATAIDA